MGLFRKFSGKLRDKGYWELQKKFSKEFSDKVVEKSMVIPFLKEPLKNEEIRRGYEKVFTSMFERSIGSFVAYWIIHKQQKREKELTKEDRVKIDKLASQVVEKLKLPRTRKVLEKTINKLKKHPKMAEKLKKKSDEEVKRIKGAE